MVFAFVFNSWLFCLCSAMKNGTCTQGLCIPSNYNRLVPPTVPVHVNTSFVLMDIINVSEVDFTITFRFTFSYSWREPRLVGYENLTPKMDKYEAISLSFMKKLWFPDLYIFDLKSIKVNEIMDTFSGT